MSYTIKKDLLNQSLKLFSDGIPLSESTVNTKWFFKPCLNGATYYVNYEEIDLLSELSCSVGIVKKSKKYNKVFLNLYFNVSCYPKTLGRDIFTAKDILIEDITYLCDYLNSKNYRYLLSPYTDNLCKYYFNNLSLKNFVKQLILHCDKGKRHASIVLLKSLNKDFAIKNNIGSIQELYNFIDLKK